MKKILVPTDFSPNADRAIDYAVRIAKLNQATLYIIHACDHLYEVDMENVLSKEEYNKKQTEEAFGKLEMIRQSIEETEQVLVGIKLYSGTVTDTIVVAAEEHNADLIILGTLGISGIRDRIFGSKTAYVISNSSIPVLAIPIEYDWSPPAKFLLAINRFNEVNEILNPVFDLAGVFKAELLITVFTDNENEESSEYLEDEKKINSATDKLKATYGNLVIRSEHLSGRNFEDSINDYIEENSIDLLAMTTHKRTLIGSIFNRSLTRKMSYHTKVPILAIPVQ